MMAADPLVGHVGPWERPRKGGSTMFLRWYVLRSDGRHIQTRPIARLPRLGKRAHEAEWRAAEAQAAELERQLSAQTPPPAYAAKHIGVALDWYEEYLDGGLDLAPPAAARSTLAIWLRIASEFTQFAQRHLPEIRWTGQFSIRMVEAWLADYAGERDGRARKPATVNAAVCALQHYLDFLWRQGWMREKLILADEGVLRKVWYNEPVILTDEAIRSVLAALTLKGLERPAAELLAATGMRRNELLGLRRADCNPQTGVLTIPAGRETTKRHERVLPLGPRAADIARRLYLAAGSDDAPLIPLAGWRLNEALKRNGATPRDLRRWFCTALERLGAPSYTIDRLMGHVGPRTRRHYSGESSGEPWRPEEAGRWLAAVEALLWPPNKCDKCDGTLGIVGHALNCRA